MPSLLHSVGVIEQSWEMERQDNKPLDPQTQCRVVPGSITYSCLISRQSRHLLLFDIAGACQLARFCVFRYERTANDMLAKSTIAGQEGVITYLANAAALQQFEQTGLAYVLMHEAGRSMGASGLAAAAESLLEGKFEVGIVVPSISWSTCKLCYHHHYSGVIPEV